MQIAVLSHAKKLYTIRRLGEAAAARGHKTTLIRPAHAALVAATGRLALFSDGREIDGVEAVIPRLAGESAEFGFHIVQHFELKGLPVLNTATALRRARDRIRTLQLAVGHGLPVLRTVVARETTDVDRAIAEVGGLPVVLKPLSRTRAVQTVVAKTKRAARSILETYWGLKQEVMVQEYIAEADGRDLRAFVVDGEVVAAVRRDGQPIALGADTNPGWNGQSVDLRPEQIAVARGASEALGLAVTGVDMLETKDGGVRVLEVNPAAGLEALEQATGRDLAGVIVDRMVRLGASRR